MKRIIVGRGNDSDIVIPDETDNVSRRHFVITFNFFGKMKISDTSSNGTFINGERMLKGTSIPVTRNDQVRLGSNWIFDWTKIKDPYRKTRIALISSFVAVALLLSAILVYVYFKAGKEMAVKENVVVTAGVDAPDNVDTWNKDSTESVAPVATSIDVGGKKSEAGSNRQKTKKTGKKAKSLKNTFKDSKNNQNEGTGEMPLIN